MPNIALRVENVSKKFRKDELHDSLRDLIPALARRMVGRKSERQSAREFWAVRDVSFELPRGEALGIVGANGAGKSTLLKLITRILRPTTGTIEMHGRLSALIEVNAGFHPDLTGRENIYLNGTILGMRREEIDSKFDEIVEFSGLSSFLDMPVKRYSSGMYARLGFSVAAHVNPDVMIVDEVLSVGDYIFQQKCVERMKRIIRSGTTVLFVSHNLKAVAEFCSSCLMLDQGSVRRMGSAEEVIRCYLDDFGNGKNRRVSDGPVAITKVSVRDECGAQVKFTAGQKAWIDIEIKARERCEQVATILYFRDEHHYQLTNNSDERLGYGSVTLEPGQIYRCTFEVTLNFGSGVFYPCVALVRYDVDETYDYWEPAGTIYITSEADIRGGVNCFPKVVRQQICEAESGSADEAVSQVASLSNKGLEGRQVGNY